MLGMLVGVNKRVLIKHGWLPLQHGAWSMTFTPLLLGIILGGWNLWQLLLVLSWTCAFLFFNVFGLLIKARRKERYWTATITYGVLSGAGALALVLAHPHLLVWAPALAVFFTWAIVEILRKNERSLGARVSAILASSLMTPIAYSLGANAGNWDHVWAATAVVALYFIGTVPFVKTMIRERGKSAWLRGSILYHVALVAIFTVGAALGWLSWAVPVVGLILLARAWSYPIISKRRQTPLSPQFVGITEFVFTALVLLSVIWT